MVFALRFNQALSGKNNGRPESGPKKNGAGVGAAEVGSRAENKTTLEECEK